MFRNVSECCGMVRVASGCLGFVQNVAVRFGMVRDVSGYSACKIVFGDLHM